MKFLNGPRLPESSSFHTQAARLELSSRSGVGVVVGVDVGAGVSVGAAVWGWLLRSKVGRADGCWWPWGPETASRWPWAYIEYRQYRAWGFSFPLRWIGAADSRGSLTDAGDGGRCAGLFHGLNTPGMS